MLVRRKTEQHISYKSFYERCRSLISTYVTYWYCDNLERAASYSQFSQHTPSLHTRLFSNKSNCNHQRHEVSPPHSNFATTTNRHGYTYPDPTTRITRHSRALLDLGREEPTTWSANPTHMTIDPYQTLGPISPPQNTPQARPVK